MLIQWGRGMELYHGVERHTYSKCAQGLDDTRALMINYRFLERVSLIQQEEYRRSLRIDESQA